jgi:hypothetical protein
MTKSQKQRLRKMTFLNTHRLTDDKYKDKDKTFIEKTKNDYIIAITRGRLRPQHI